MCDVPTGKNAFARVPSTLLVALLFTFLVGCATPPVQVQHSIPAQHPTATVPTPQQPPEPPPAPATGMASYYSNKYQGHRTASGEIYDARKMTAAHRSLPFGVKVRVTDLSNNRSVIVRINDRGPFVRNRIIDLSLAAARQLGIVQHGSAQVRLEILSERADRAGLDSR